MIEISWFHGMGRITRDVESTTTVSQGFDLSRPHPGAALMGTPEADAILAPFIGRQQPGPFEESWLFGPLDNPRRLAVLVLLGVWVFVLGYAIGRSMTVEERTVEVVKALEDLEGVK